MTTPAPNPTNAPANRWVFDSFSDEYMGLTNASEAPAVDVEVAWTVTWNDDDVREPETAKASLVPPGQTIWHKRKPSLWGTNPQEPRTVTWEARWQHPYDGAMTERSTTPRDI